MACIRRHWKRARTERDEAPVPTSEYLKKEEDAVATNEATTPRVSWVVKGALFPAPSCVTPRASWMPCKRIEWNLVLPGQLRPIPRG